MDAAPRVVVAGMHRSGTTLLTRALVAAGAVAGRPEDLMPGAASNPDGHYEVLRVARVNDDVLAATGQHWAGPLGGHDDELAALADGPLGDDARQILAEQLRGVDVVKDPRFCLTLPFWRKVLPAPPVIVLPWRHPAEVADSLHARNAMPIEFGRLLWSAYHRRLAAGAAGLERVVIDHRSIIADPPMVVAAVAEATGLQLALDPGGTSDVVRDELLHHRSDDSLDAEEAALLDALRSDGAVPPLADSEHARRELLFGSVAPMGIAHDTVRAKLVGHPRRLL